jgi:subtilisin family serine protease
VLAVVTATIAVVSAAPPSAAREPDLRGTESPSRIPGSYIVVLNDGASLGRTGVATRARGLAGAHGVKVTNVYESVLYGFAATMSEAAAKKLAADPAVDYVAQDQMLELADTEDNPPSWGLDRVDQRNRPLDTTYSYDLAAGTPVHAYVVDSGIRITHNDFGGRATWGWNFFDNNPVASDCLGHGTHVAGTLGGRTYGVAKDVRLVSVKVFGCTKNTPAEIILAGINWVTANAVKPAVVNVSIGWDCQGNPCSPEAVDMVGDAITNSINSGLTYTVSAGNDNVDSCTGLFSRVPLAITVGATDINDARASYSDWGRCVNIFAPGGDLNAGTPGIPSAGIANDNDVAIKQGTSMAAPHVAGAAALILGRPGGATKTPQQVANELLNTNATSGVVTDPVAGHNSTTKLLYTAPPPVAGGSSIALARNRDGRMSLFGVDQAGLLQYRTQNAVNADSWSGWRKSVNPGWYSVAAEADFDGRLELIALNRARQDIWHRTQAVVNTDNWSVWRQFDGLLTSATVAFNSQGRLELFGTNGQGQVFRRAQTGPGSETWTGWDPAYFRPAGLRSVAAEKNANDVIEVFGLTRTGEVWHSLETAPSSGVYTGWTRLAGSPALRSIAVARNSNGLLELFGTDSAGQAHRRSAVQGIDAWLPWTPLNQPAAVGALRSVTAETNADGRVEVFTVNTSGQIWHRWQSTAGSLTYSPWVQLDGTLRP